MSLHIPPCDPQAIFLRIRSAVELHGGPTVIAALANMPKPTLDTYMAGKNLPGTLALAQLSHAMNISVDWILFGEAR